MNVCICCMRSHVGINRMHETTASFEAPNSIVNAMLYCFHTRAVMDQNHGGVKISLNALSA